MKSPWHARLAPRRTHLTRTIICLMATIAIVGSVHAAQERWKLAFDQSQHACLDPYRWFLVRVGNVLPEVGQIVTFQTDGIALYPDNTLFTKKVLAREGAVVEVSPFGVSVDGISLPFTEEALARLSEAGVESRLRGVEAYKVPPGHLFVVGTNPRSYDSRYYGPVAVDRIIGTARPLW